MEYIEQGIRDAKKLESTDPDLAIEIYGHILDELSVLPYYYCWDSKKSNDINTWVYNRRNELRRRRYEHQYMLKQSPSPPLSPPQPQKIFNEMPSPPQQTYMPQLQYQHVPPTLPPELQFEVPPLPPELQFESPPQIQPQQQELQFESAPQTQSEQPQPQQYVPPPSYNTFMKSYIQCYKEKSMKDEFSMQSMIMRNENGPLGLVNNGQNNCFMNAVVQVLWNLSAFSSEISSIEQHTCTRDHKCVLCALQIIFSALRYSIETVDPIGLRRALGALSSNFAVKDMGDASEAFTYILDELHKATMQKDSEFDCCIVHKMFSIDILDIKYCSCGFYSDEMSHTRRWNCIVPAQYIIDEHRKDASKSFGDLIGEYEKDTPTKCPRCKKNSLSTKRDFDPRLPKVFTVNIAWGYSESKDNVSSFVRFIPQEFNMNEFIPGSNATYILRGMVMFYGKHYYTYFYKLRDGSDTIREWKMFDDSLVKPIGTWENLTEIIIRGKAQPIQLFYVEK